ncbi:MAG: hypothetical protein K8S24_02695 [Candidatus Aegiribacteria sp.]|nr:hypothetical protein [Candidatus Aegiribacteria sp.]
MNPIGWILFLFALGIINLIVAVKGIRGFLSQETSIRTYQSLENFKSFARKQMYQALLQLTILGTMVVIGIVAMFSRKLDFNGTLLFLLLNVINVFAGKWGKGFENKARSLKVEDPDLLEEYNSVCRSWFRKPFPDF